MRVAQPRMAQQQTRRHHHHLRIVLPLLTRPSSSLAMTKTTTTALPSPGNLSLSGTPTRCKGHSHREHRLTSIASVHLPPHRRFASMMASDAGRMALGHASRKALAYSALLRQQGTPFSHNDAPQSRLQAQRQLDAAAAVMRRVPTPASHPVWVEGFPLEASGSVRRTAWS